jgi:putative nucleotidyltransferase with HDIG domain
MADRVRIDELKVGMFVHLDRSWMSHPFARSSFRIERAEQIAQLRDLGMSELRWDPARSEIPNAPTAAEPTSVDAPKVEAPVTEALVDDTAREAEARRLILRRQRESAAQAEAQYAEASEAWRSAFGRVATDPQAARRETEALSQALVSKMLAEDDLCIRTLSLAAGDNPSAHAMNVAVLSMLLARMLQLPQQAVADVGTGALVHDIGKLNVPQRLWHADPQLNAAERAVYESHVDQGLRLARRMGLGATATQVIAQHHESNDGSGFPRRLQGEDIAMAARIVNLVNRFDRLCNPPSLTRAVTPHEALSDLFAHHRSQFDSAVLSAFIRMMGVYPAGSVVQLTDERFALVISVNPARPLKPSVLVFDPATPADEALHLDLGRTSNLGIRRSLRAAQLPAAARDYLAPKPRMAYFFEPGTVPELETQAA